MFGCSFGVGVSCFFFVFDGKDNLLFLVDKKKSWWVMFFLCYS